CFFFQAEDGIRDGHVTGVQTCALPISSSHRESLSDHVGALAARRATKALQRATRTVDGDRKPELRHWGSGRHAKPCDNPKCRFRSEERRVGKEGRSR